jgi:hypothetical protein
MSAASSPLLARIREHSEVQVGALVILGIRDILLLAIVIDFIAVVGLR